MKQSIIFLCLWVATLFISCEKELIRWDKDYIITGDPSQVGLRYTTTSLNEILYNDQTVDFPIDMNQDGGDDLIVSKNTGHTRVSSFLTVGISGTYYILCDSNDNALVFSSGDTLRSDGYHQLTSANIFSESHWNCESEGGCAHREQGYWADQENKYLGVVSPDGKLGWIRMTLRSNLRISGYGILQ